MAELTDNEVRFLYSQRIDDSAVMDCSWMRSRRYKAAMEQEGYLWCISPTACYNGHRLRSRPGHCIQCDTSRIAFVKRHHDAAYIYIAGSLASKVVKVGSAIWPERRLSALNSRYYGGILDWTLLYQVRFEAAGKIEFETHGRLFGYRIGIKEIFRCNYKLARKAIAESSSGQCGTDEWERRLAATSYRFDD
ncbi:GIY-YIG nuclease family protein [Bradyrhizobium sp. 193]|uniref:GIY-YIG nuclease family protein n=1 Tax=Bradyrhizobium sp. 193 TaxID=2782661 RepID=UPI001FFB1099|nr:GIY-YIG nuclease family protein [Bradyrhizobium sp. 193]MCK1485915.1 GIY-YIG nuclease family protein [Bradyrhizobium sp. 193]